MTDFYRDWPEMDFKSCKLRGECEFTEIKPQGEYLWRMRRPYACLFSFRIRFPNHCVLHSIWGSYGNSWGRIDRGFAHPCLTSLATFAAQEFLNLLLLKVASHEMVFVETSLAEVCSQLRALAIRGPMYVFCVAGARDWSQDVTGERIRTSCLTGARLRDESSSSRILYCPLQGILEILV